MCILLNVKKHEKTFALNVDIFSQYYANVKKLQNLFINGIYTRKLLLDTLIMCGERL